jgi:Tfp pilus assembly protein PilN
VLNKLNLATHPFRNRTLPYLLALGLCTVAAVAVIFGLTALRNARAQEELAQKQIQEINAQLAGYKEQENQIQQSLTPEQKALLIAAHKLVAQKYFGWSRLFADLERVLPGSVSVSRINVENVYQNGDRTQAELEFAVLSRDYQSVMNMIETMNSSGIFRAELRGQDLQKKDHFSYTEYSLFLIYTQPRGYATAPVEQDIAQGGAQQ